MPMLYPLPLAAWDEPLAATETAIATDALEAGHVLFLPDLRFELTDAERRFLGTDGTGGPAAGVSLPELRALAERFVASARALAETLFPAYRKGLEPAATELPTSSRRKDDAQLRLDSFAGRPSLGKRIMKVFSNVSPDGRARVWRVGEPFEAVAGRFWHELRPPLPGERRLLAAVRVTCGVRSRYDHYMLKLSDAMRSDVRYQGQFASATCEFPAGSTWVCFTDQVSHAAVGGARPLEQAFWVDVGVLRHQESAPLRVLEGLAGRKLA